MSSVVKSEHNTGHVSDVTHMIMKQNGGVHDFKSTKNTCMRCPNIMDLPYIEDAKWIDNIVRNFVAV